VREKDQERENQFQKPKREKERERNRAKKEEGGREERRDGCGAVLMPSAAGRPSIFLSFWTSHAALYKYVFNYLLP